MNQQPPWPPPQQPPYGQPPYGQPPWSQQAPPYYGQLQQQFQQPQRIVPTKKRYYSLWALGVIAALSIGALSIFAAISGINIHTNTAGVGDTITLDSISCTLISVSNTYAPGYITIRIKLINNSDGEYHYYASDFHLKTSSGSIIDAEELGIGALAPGGSGEGVLNFLIDNPHDAELLWQPIGHLDDLSHVWKLGL